MNTDGSESSSRAADHRREKRQIARAKRGDPQAARALIDDHKDRLFNFVWRVVRNHHDAEELCQDAFLKAFAALDSFSTDFRFSTWLFTIAYRLCLNFLRRRKALTGEVDFNAWSSDAPPADRTVTRSEDAQRLTELVWTAVDRLTVPQRATVVLFYRHGYGCQEISQVLQLPVATVKSHLHRARGRLRELLEPVVGDEDLGRFRIRAAQAG